LKEKPAEEKRKGPSPSFLKRKKKKNMTSNIGKQEPSRWSTQKEEGTRRPTYNSGEEERLQLLPAEGEMALSGRRKKKTSS